MDVVMTEEERAEMEAAAKESDAAGVEGDVDVDPAATSPTVKVSEPTASTASTTPAATATEPSTSLSTSSPSTTPNATPSASSTDLSKKGAAAKKKPKLTPEQRAQLDALEKKRDDEKKVRWVDKANILMTMT